MNDTPSVAEAVQAQVSEAVADAVVVANERAEAAQEALALVTEAAIERAISERVDDCEEGIEQCENRNEALQSQVTALQSQLTELSTTLPQLVTLEVMAAEIAKLSAPPSIPKPSPHPNPDQNPPQNPDDAGGHPDQVPENPPKPKRYHLT
jgi:chaperonin cofactor prefoldin